MIEAASPQTRDFTPLEELEAALDWWRMAGVENHFVDTPHSWLAKPEAEEVVTAPAPTPPTPPRRTPLQRAMDNESPVDAIGGSRANWPQDLAAFREWWMHETSLSDANMAQRVAPRGAADANLMVLTGVPVVDGATNRLLAAILRAMGLNEDETYLASALPAPAALPEWSVLATRGLGAVTAHHIALAQPQRVLAFGRELAPLFGIAPEAAREPAAMGEGETPLLLAVDLAQIARSPARRRNFWNRWLDWIR